MSKIQDIANRLRAASKAYYDGDTPIMSDAAFDVLKDELEELDPKNAFLAVVGESPSSTLPKVTHSIPMGSLKKITKDKQLATWLKSTGPTAEYVCQLKLDGSSIELLYRSKDGGPAKFVQAVTRGDGSVGNDVTHSIKHARCFPKTIPTKKSVSVRCEALLPLGAWKAHFSDKKNPRNAANGIVSRLDGKGSEHISCIAFDVEFEGGNRFKTEQDKIDWLTNSGFTATPSEVVKAHDLPKAIKRVEDKRDKLPFQIDGAVLKLNDIATQEKLGEHAGRPRWARAWKFAAMGGFSTLLGIEWNVGTMGTIDPVALIAPVDVAGVTIKRASVHNMAQIELLGLHIGDEIEVVRAGDVIPHVVRVVSPGKNRRPIIITKCPGCGSKLVRPFDKKKKSVGPKLFCSNTGGCGAVVIKKIQKWVKKRNIKELGNSCLKALIVAKVVRTIPDLYALDANKMNRAGLGTAVSKKILAEIEKSRNCTLSELIGSLSIDMLGRREAAKLVKLGINTLGRWRLLTGAEIRSFSGYEETKSSRIVVGVRKNWRLVEEIAACLTITSSRPKSTKLRGKSFCFTGTMRQHKRPALETMVTDASGEVRSVSKKLNFLVVGTDAGSKLAKAKQLGVKTIGEADFLRML